MYALTKLRNLDYLIERYYWDPVGFTQDVIEAEPTREQVKILDSAVKHRHVSTRSGHGIGKSSSLSWLILWFLCTRGRDTKIPCTASGKQQLYDVLWSELAKWHGQMNLVFKRLLEPTTSRLMWKAFPKEAFAVARTARKDRPEALSGYHAKHLMYIIEEASGVVDEIFLPVEGSLTTENNICVMAGNPIRRSGFFYDSHNSDRGRWHTLHFNSDHSELVSAEYPERIAKKYGRDSNIYRVRVEGEFPEKEDDQLIDLTWLEEAAINENLSREGRKVWALDVARYGGDETVLGKKHGDEIIEIKGIRSRDTMQVAGWVKHDYDLAADDEKPDEINVDTIGVGSGVADRLREQHLPIQDIEVSRSPNHPEHPELFLNLRAQLGWEYAEALKEKRLKIPNDEDLIGQSSTVKYFFNSNGKMQIESKDQMKSRGLTSPDRYDVATLLFARPGTLIYAM
jgi:hypothetical protein